MATRTIVAAEPIETDALIVGAGPVGLFQVFELGLQEVRAEVVDSLPHAGGQCFELYADKPIYDVPAMPYGTGRELTERLLKQIEPFGAGFHLDQQVNALARRDDGRFDVATSAGRRFVAKAVVVAGGVGSFQPRRLKVDGLDRYRGTQLFEHAATLHEHAGKRVVIVGGTAAAVAAALAGGEDGAAAAASVTLVHRRDDFDADEATRARLNTLRASGRIEFVAGQPEAIVANDGRLAALTVLGSDGASHELPLDVLFVLLGWSPKLGPIADWGLALDKKQIVVNTASFETSTPGIFAVGDVNTYPGKQKLIVCGFHEATLAAFAIGELVHPERAQPLQYTTTSAKLHRLLGVAPGLP
jgi:thioredoxin reductase (NADPH)